MPRWTIQDLVRVDSQYAEHGIPHHQRPLRAAQDLLGATPFDLVQDPEVQRLTAAYADRFPEVSTTWPGSGIGFAASLDQVRKATIPVVFGRVGIQVWQALGFSSDRDWWTWCREDEGIAHGTAFAFADMADFAMGVGELRSPPAEAKALWKMARSNLEDIANTLPTAFSVDSVIQPICLVAELSMKGALVACGEQPDTGRSGHDLTKLAERVARARAHKDDELVAEVISKLPPYVASRYAPAGLSRLEVVRLGLGVQFIAASAIRRLGTRDIAAQMAAQGPRPPLFTGASAQRA